MADGMWPRSGEPADLRFTAIWLCNLQCRRSMSSQDVLLDLSRYDRIGFDFETTGVDINARPVGMGLSLPDGTRRYIAWGHGDPEGLRGPASHGNNVSLPEFLEWGNRELTRPNVVRVAHYAAFEHRMAAYINLKVTGVECSQVCATLLNEHRRSFALNDLAKDLGIGAQTADEVHA